MSDLLMPSPAEGVEEATIARWLKQSGDVVAVGDELLEVETDKVTILHEAEAAGVLEIVAPEGSSVPVGTVIGRIVEAGAEVAATAAPVAAAPEAPAPDEQVQGERGPEHEDAPVPVAAAAAPAGSAAVRATPLARLIARRQGIDLTSIAGTGPYGLVTRTDVTGEPSAPAARIAVASAPVTGNGHAAPGRNTEPTIETLSRVQKVIARRMVEAKSTVPDFQVQTEVVIDDVLELRAQIKELADVRVPSVNDFVLKAAALALREHPRVNASFSDEQFVLHPNVNVGFAVAADDALIVPTIRDADRRSLLEIAAEARRLADRVRSGSFTPEDISGGTFTVSNLGMFGMTSMTPIINVPQAAILGVAAARDVPQIGDDGSLVRRRLMTLTLSCDHRILYGADAARFLSLVRTLLEQPLRLMLDAQND
jgi:pyruvate dehydrogenase E2 component (dihydrolipoamide acetyltransferase)